MNSIFDKIKSKDFLEMLKIVSDKIDVNKCYEDYITNHNGKMNLYAKWEESLLKNNPDYSVYDSEYYLDEAFVCWKKYCRDYLKELKKYVNNNENEYAIELLNSNNILDLGCGIGYSTVALSEIFPKAHVVGTQLSYSLQWDICKTLENNYVSFVSSEYNYTLAQSFDIIFASELFEHFDHPIAFLRDLLNAYEPKFIICANTFTQMSLGHFYYYYDIDNNQYTGKQMNKIFNTYLRNNNYTKLKTKFWNQRPAIWVKNVWIYYSLYK